MRIIIFNHHYTRKMSWISISIEGKEKTISKLKSFSNEDFKLIRQKWLSESAIELEWEAKKEAPVDKWILRKSIGSKVFWDYAMLFSNVSYAIFVHEWTQPHIIKPLKKKALFWPWAKYPVKLVKHPGTKANPFFYRAINNKKESVSLRLSNIVDDFITKRFWWSTN